MAGVIVHLCRARVVIVNTNSQYSYKCRTFKVLHTRRKYSNNVSGTIDINNVSTTLLRLSCFHVNSQTCTYLSSLLQKNKDNEAKTSGGILATTINRVTAAPVQKSQPVRGCFHPGASALSRESLKLTESGPITGRQMVVAMLQYIWPKDDKSIRDRVKLAVSLLIGAKVLNVTVPFIFKYSVDYLNAAGHLNVDSAAETVTTMVTALLLGCK